MPVHDWILAGDGYELYLILFLLLMGGAIGLPIPEDLPLIFGGVATHRGSADIRIVFIVCYLSILLGDVVIYSLGRRWGNTLLNRGWFKAKLAPSRLKRIRLNLERKSLMMIFIARHLFYLRTATFLTCGAVKMNFRRFIIADALAALISAPLMLGIGYLFSENYEPWLKYVKEAKYFSVLLGVLILIVILIYRRHRAEEQEPDTELP